MPCLNEAETLKVCIQKALGEFKKLGIDGEVLIADNGSTDGSQEIAVNCGARVVPVTERGYGSALRGGIAAAEGKFIIMGDADDSYDFSNLGPFIEKLREGYDLVMGNRFRGGIAPGAMPFLHKYLGNPVLTWIGKLFFKCPADDFHCGLRGFTKEAANRMNLRTTGMEFASEMVIKATISGMRIAEVPTTLSPDGRSRAPHLRTWRDGWRHLRFMLLFSPNWLFLYPGMLLFILGAAMSALLIANPIEVGGITLDIQTLLFASTSIIIGFQAVLFALFTKVFAISTGLIPPDSMLYRASKRVSLEAGVIYGLIILAAGFAGSLYSLEYWASEGFGPLDVQQTMRVVIPSITAVILGFQCILGSFFTGVLKLNSNEGS
ncbi:MAG: dolichol-P-glucose synthetase [Deltaproteobacteria bacterium]|nr:MAG: dolichol-P-glucose synthetase [Deltaproteobacteria bacterium]